MKVSFAAALCSLVVLLASEPDSFAFGQSDNPGKGPDSFLQIPPRAQSLLGKRASLNGPNCWNAALYTSGLISGIRHVTNTEFSYTVAKNCVEVEESERLAGDIVAFRRSSKTGKLVNGPTGFEIHAFVLVSRDQAFTKNGSLALNEYRIQDIGSLKEEYETSNRLECRILDIPREMCQLKAQVFRCKKDSTSAETAESNNSPKLKALKKSTLVLEDELNALYLNDASNLNREQIKTSMKERISLLENESHTLRNSGSSGDDLDQIDLRLESLRVFMF